MRRKDNDLYPNSLARDGKREFLFRHPHCRNNISSAYDSRDEKEMKMNLQKHIDEYKAVAERVEQTIANKRNLQDSFEDVNDLTLVRIFSGEINIYENMLREIKATIRLLEDMKGDNPELLDNSELLEDKP